MPLNRVLNKTFYSVIMSVFNDEKHLSQCIESILSQTFKDFKFLIIDDASLDNSRKIIEDYALIDQRIEAYYNKKNKGLTKNLNFGLRKARGEWIVRQDSDDISLSNRLENAYEIIQKKEFDFYSTPVKLLSKTSGKIIPNYFTRTFFDPRFLEFKNCLVHGTLIIKRSVILEIQYDESYRYSQDFKLYHDLLNKGYRMFYDNQSITYLLRIHKNQISIANNKEQFENLNKILILNGFKRQNSSISRRFTNKLLELKIVINDFIRRSLYS